MHSCFLTTWLWNRGESCWWVMLIWWEHCDGLLETFCVGSSCHFSASVVERTNISKHQKTIPHHTWKCCCKCRSCGYYKHWIETNWSQMLKFPTAIISLQHHSYKQQNPHETTTYHGQHDSTTFVEVSLISLVWCMKMQSPTKKFLDTSFLFARCNKCWGLGLSSTLFLFLDDTTLWLQSALQPLVEHALSLYNT
jgi:hypothetical protein